MSGPSKLSELQARLAALGEKARQGLPERATSLRSEAARLDAGAEDARESITRLAHRLRGVAANAGRADLTERAARLEAAAKTDAAPLAIAEGARRLADAIDAPPSPAAPTAVAAPRASEGPTKLGWRVVALDDERSTRRLLEITLRQGGGCDAELFEEPGAAMRSVINAPPDLVIVDAMMPDVDGLTFYRGVRRQVGEIPVVILSAAAPDELGWELPDDPRLRWMRKPFRPGHLLAALREFLEAELPRGS